MTHARHAPRSHARGPSKRALRAVLALTAAFAVVEVIGGLLTGSLALLADAAHMLSDSAAIGLALLAIWLAERPASPQRSFGLHRAEILAALTNGVALVAISAWIFYEASRRLSDPPEVLGGPMLAVAAAGLAANVVAALILVRGGRGTSLNVSAALRHVVSDLLGSLGALVAAGVILLTGWRYADPLVSVVIGTLVLASAWPVLRESLGVLLEAAPRGVDVTAVGRRMAAADGVKEVHDLHIWTITSGFPALSAHVVVGRDEDCHARRRELEAMLRREFEFEHTTLQVDHESGDELLSIDVPSRRG